MRDKLKWTLRAAVLVGVALVWSLRAPNLQLRRAPNASADSAGTEKMNVPADSVVKAAPGRIPGTDLASDIPEIDWVLLSRLNLRTGVADAALDTLNGKRVRIPGFVLPLDDMTLETASFLLVPYVGACVHTPPPPANQLVQVVMSTGLKVPVSWWAPVYIEGVIEIKTVDSPYGRASFFMDGMRAIDFETTREILPAVTY